MRRRQRNPVFDGMWPWLLLGGAAAAFVLTRTPEADPPATGGLTPMPQPQPGTGQQLQPGTGAPAMPDPANPVLPVSEWDRLWARVGGTSSDNRDPVWQASGYQPDGRDRDRMLSWTAFQGVLSGYSKGEKIRGRIQQHLDIQAGLALPPSVTFSVEARSKSNDWAYHISLERFTGASAVRMYVQAGSTQVPLGDQRQFRQGWGFAKCVLGEYGLSRAPVVRLHFTPLDASGRPLPGDWHNDPAWSASLGAYDAATMGASCYEDDNTQYN